MPTINRQEEAASKTLIPLSLTIGELLACTEASTKLYAHIVKEYIKMKEIRSETQPAMRERLWLIVSIESSIDKFQRIIESIKVSALAEYRELERINPPPLNEQHILPKSLTHQLIENQLPTSKDFQFAPQSQRPYQ